ncbi:hypothetical protein IVB18_45520 [Bradyrhizobium sp. 186]|uniref:hypothetical protein n=1 Tax=Bradyrhizobium sp. 186 TaxID=2782654 RepID=UPI00200065B9|nr:hypothetical protein [Bradyrhizobium sp. 186]UPK35159.1 hypothetical protein IVB18_45520 [Bradyrhizobium sp. 186]
MTDKPKRISAKVRAAIDAMFADTVKTVTDAADHVGISREHLSRELSKPHVTEFMRQKTMRRLVVGAPHAASTKLALLDSPNEMVRDRASSFVLGLIGIRPDPEQDSRQGTPVPGLVIVVENHAGQPPVTIGPEPVRQIEHEPVQIEQE